MSRELVWATDLRFDSIGVIFRVRSEDQEFGDLVADLSRHFPETNAAADMTISLRRDRGRYWVYREEERALSTASRDEALLGVLAMVNEATLEATSHSLMVHAGAVALDGQVIAFPASAESGKSTLVAACLLAGFEYVTDEGLVVMSKDGEIRPYPKALWLTVESMAMLGLEGTRLLELGDVRHKSPIMPEALTAKVAWPPLRLRHLVLPRRGAGVTSLEPIGGGETAIALVTHAFNRYDQPREWFDLTVGVARRARGWTLDYDQPGEAAALLLRLLEAG